MFREWIKDYSYNEYGVMMGDGAELYIRFGL
jgi:hypothetical protein